MILIRIEARLAAGWIGVAVPPAVVQRSIAIEVVHGGELHGGRMAIGELDGDSARVSLGGRGSAASWARSAFGPFAVIATGFSAASARAEWRIERVLSGTESVVIASNAVSVGNKDGLGRS